nr:hypothetical protein [Thiocapsa sp. KS1]
MMPTFITTQQLADRIQYDERYIRERLVPEVLVEGVHYLRPFGRRKLLFVWEAIEQELFRPESARSTGIPLANGGVCRG